MTLRPLRLPLAALLLSLAGCFEASTDPAQATAAAPVAAATPGPRALVVHAGGTALVLSRGLDAQVTRGEVTLLSPEWPSVVRRDLSTDVLTPDELRWHGRTVRLHGDSGPVCEAVVTGIEARGRVELYDTSDLAIDEAALPAPADSIPVVEDDTDIDVGRIHATGLDWDALTARAWERVPDQGSLDLVARLEVTRGDCSGALWAQLADEPAPASAAAEPADDALSSLALAAVRASSAYRDAQQDYDAFRDEPPADGSTDDEPAAGPLPASWEEYQPGQVEVHLIGHPGGESYVVTVLQAGEICGRFGAELAQLWQLRDGALEEVPAALSVDDLPVGAVDLDGDGHVELLLREGYLRWADGAFSEAESTSIPRSGCRC